MSRHSCIPAQIYSQDIQNIIHRVTDRLTITFIIKLTCMDIGWLHTVRIKPMFRKYE